jgi:hypothetical protein
MKIRHTALAVALATAFAAGTAVAQDPIAPPVTPPVTTEVASPMTETDVRAAMGAEGYTEINDVKFSEGVWTADAKSADGNHVEVKLDATTGKIIPDEHVAKISKDEVIVKVQAAGYTNVHDVDFEGGVWKVEANDSAGNDVELKVDPDNGRILGSEKDAIGGNKP